MILESRQTVFWIRFPSMMCFRFSSRQLQLKPQRKPLRASKINLLRFAVTPDNLEIWNTCCRWSAAFHLLPHCISWFAIGGKTRNRICHIYHAHISACQPKVAGAAQESPIPSPRGVNPNSNPNPPNYAQFAAT